MRRCRGIVSKALLMSIAIIMVLGAGLSWFKPSRIVCVMSVRRVFVECWGLKPCCAGESGMCAEMLFRTSLSSIFAGVQSSAIGLYEAGSVWGFVRFQNRDNFGKFPGVGYAIVDE